MSKSAQSLTNFFKRQILHKVHTERCTLKDAHIDVSQHLLSLSFNLILKIPTPR